MLRWLFLLVVFPREGSAARGAFNNDTVPLAGFIAALATSGHYRHVVIVGRCDDGEEGDLITSLLDGNVDFYVGLACPGDGGGVLGLPAAILPAGRVLYFQLAAAAGPVGIGTSGAASLYIPDGHDLSPLGLRLDSRVFAYAPVGAGRYAVEEAFAVKGGPVVRNPLFAWDPEAGLSGPYGSDFEDLFQRRTPFLRGVTVSSAQAVRGMPISGYVGGRYAGYMPDFLRIMQDRMGYNSSMLPNRRLPDGRYDVNIGHQVELVASRRVDFSQIPLAPSASRLDDIDVTSAVFLVTNDLFAADANAGKTEPGLSYWAFVDVVAVAAWYLALAAAALSAAGASLAFLHQERAEGRRSDWRSMLQMGIEYVYVSALQFDYPASASSASVRIASFTVCAGAFLMFAAYSAVLTSTMTVISPPERISSFEEALELEYKFISMKNSLAESAMRTAPAGSPLHRAYRVWEGERAGLTRFQVQDRLTVAHPPTVYYGPHLAVLGNERIVPLGVSDGRYHIHFGLPLQLGSELTEMFQHHIQVLRESGVLDRLFREWLVPKKSLEQSSSSLAAGELFEVDPLGIKQVVFLGFLLSLGVAGGVALGLAERCRGGGGGGRNGRPPSTNASVI